MRWTYERLCSNGEAVELIKCLGSRSHDHDHSTEFFGDLKLHRFRFDCESLTILFNFPHCLPTTFSVYASSFSSHFNCKTGSTSPWMLSVRPLTSIAPYLASLNEPSLMRVRSALPFVWRGVGIWNDGSGTGAFNVPRVREATLPNQVGFLWDSCSECRAQSHWPRDRFLPWLQPARRDMHSWPTNYERFLSPPPHCSWFTSSFFRIHFVYSRPRQSSDLTSFQDTWMTRRQLRSPLTGMAGSTPVT